MEDRAVRLVEALHSTIGDFPRTNFIASALGYNIEELEKDLEALYKYVTDNKKVRTSNNG